MSTITNDAGSSRPHRSGVDRSVTDLLRRRAPSEPRRITARSHREPTRLEGWAADRRGFAALPDEHAVTFGLAAELRRRLGATTEARGLPEFVLYPAAVAALAHALGSGTDLIIEVPAAGSVDPDPAGRTADPWPLRTDLADDPTLIEVLDRVGESVPEAFRAPDRPVVSGHAPAEAVPRVVIRGADGLGRAGFADNLYPAARATGQAAAGALSVGFTPDADGAVEVSVSADAGRYESATVAMFARYLRNVLEQFADDPTRRVSELRLMTSAERERVLGEWSTGVDPSDLRGLANVLRHGRAVPGLRMAVRHGSAELTYEELFQRLGAATAGAAGESDVDRLIAQLVALMPHAAVSAPADSSARAATGRRLADPAPTVGLGGLTVPMAALVAAIADRRCVAADRRRADTDPARRRADVRLFALDPDDPQLAVDLLAALTDGATLVLATAAQRTDPAALAEVIAEHAVTQVIAPPHLLAGLAARDVRLPTVQRWDVAGIGWPAELSTRLWELAPDSVATCAYRVPGYLGAAARGSLREAGRVRPVPGAKILLLDQRLRPVAPGVLGDVYVGGVALAAESACADRADAFIDDPFEPGRRLFRSGDTARWTADGRLAFTRG